MEGTLKKEPRDDRDAASAWDQTAPLVDQTKISAMLSNAEIRFGYS